jgi:hypothetical protein
MVKPSMPVWIAEQTGSRKGSYGGGVKWCAVRVKPNRPTARPPYIPHAEKLSHSGLCWPHGPLTGPFLWSPACIACPCGLSRFGSRPGFLQGNRPTIVTIFLLFFYISLHFKFSLNLNSNLVSIPTNLCNAVEYFCNIVMIKFMFVL